MRIWSFLAVLGACFAVVSCANDGQTLRPPTAEQTTTSRPPPMTFAPDLLEGPSGLRITSKDFEPGDTIPASATCNGSNTFPALDWTGLAPEDGQELALSFTDQTDFKEPVLLWLVTGISPDVTSIEAGTLPDGAVETLNDYGESGFGAPCIETSNESPRRLQFRLHVLSSPSDVSVGTPGNEAFSKVHSLTVDAAAVLTKVDSDTVPLSGINGSTP